MLKNKIEKLQTTIVTENQETERKWKDSFEDNI